MKIKRALSLLWSCLFDDDFTFALKLFEDEPEVWRKYLRLKKEHRADGT